MIGKAYNPAWAHHEALRAAARRWHRAGLLTLPQLEAIRTAYPLDFYRPPVYLRVLLFLLAVVAGLLAAGLGTALFLSTFDWLLDTLTADAVATVLFLLAAAGSWFVLEQLIRTSRLYRAGHDLALLYIALGCASAAVYCGVCWLLPPGLDPLALTSPALPLLLLPVLGLLLLAIVRYADALVTAVAYGVVLALLANVLLRFGVGRLVLPFAVMGLAVGLYQLGRRLARRSDYLYYYYCFVTLQALALSTFYLGSNYLVVREANAVLSGELISQQIPLAGVFYLFTAAVPLYYLYQGLRRPDRVWLLTGLAALAFSGYTVRFYHAVLPPAVAGTLLGAALVTGTAAVLRYLRTPRHGLTAQPDDTQRPGLNLEAVLTAETATRQGHAPTPHFEFGGGHSGGGGADSRF